MMNEKMSVVQEVVKTQNVLLGQPESLAKDSSEGRDVVFARKMEKAWLRRWVLAPRNLIFRV